MYKDFLAPHKNELPPLLDFICISPYRLKDVLPFLSFDHKRSTIDPEREPGWLVGWPDLVAVIKSTY